MLKGDRLITPSSLSTEMLDKIHNSHLGTEKCLNRARECLFWPGISKHTQEKVAQYQICNRYRNNQVKEPLMPPKVPDMPWQVLAADLFALGKDKYLVLVDYYSKYYELTKLVDSTSNTVVNALQQHMSRKGIPVILYTDNGPEFASKEFRKFVRAYQFQHITSSPWFLQSNGLVERTIQTAKKLLKKAGDDNKGPYLTILELRNPWSWFVANAIVDGSACHIINSYKGFIIIQPMAYDSQKVQQTLKESQQKEKKYFDRGINQLTPLKEGDTATMRQGNVCMGTSKAIGRMDDRRAQIICGDSQ